MLRPVSKRPSALDDLTATKHAVRFAAFVCLLMGHVLYPALRNPDLFFPLQRFVYAQKLECTRALAVPLPACFFLRSSCKMRIAVAVITGLLTVLGFLALDVLVVTHSRRKSLMYRQTN